MAEVSNFLKRKAEERQQKIDQDFGATAYGGSNYTQTATQQISAPSVSAPKTTELFTPAKAPVSRTAQARKSRIAALQKDISTYEKEVQKHSTGWRANSVIVDKSFADTNKKLSAARKELDQLMKLEKAESYGEKYDQRYKDNFVGQSKANFAVGRMTQDSSLAWNEYLNNPTEANRKYAESIDKKLEQFRKDNEAVLADDGTLPWISKSFANYLPQLADQMKAGAAGAVSGGAAGSIVPIVGTAGGARAGYVAGTGMYSYDTMRGAAFKSLIDMGVDEKTALAAAKDEGLISSLIEMADAGVDLMTLGGFSALKKGASTALKEWAGKATIKKVGTALGKYGINIATEMAEEGSQEAVSIANQRRIASGEGTGTASLAKRAVSVAGNAITGKDAEAAAQIWEAAKEGGKIAAVMGGIDAAGTRAAGKVYDHTETTRYGAEQRAAYRDDLIIGSALSYADEKSKSYQMASKLNERISTGGATDISDYEIGRLLRQMEQDAVAVADETVAEKVDHEAQQKEADLVRMAESEDEATAEYANAQLEHQEATVVSPTAQALMDAGMDAATATKQAELIQKVASGHTLSNAEMKQLKLRNPDVRKAFTEATGTEVNGTEFRKIIRTAAEVSQQRIRTEDAIKKQEQANAAIPEQENTGTEAMANEQTDAALNRANAENVAAMILEDAIARETAAEPTLRYSDGSTQTRSDFIANYMSANRDASEADAVSAFNQYAQYNEMGRDIPGTAQRREAVQARRSVSEADTAETKNSTTEDRKAPLKGRKTAREYEAEITIKRLNNLASRFGASVRLENLGDTAGTTVRNGYFDPATKTIVINAKRGTNQFLITRYFAHEVTHLAQEGDTKLTKDILGAMKKIYGEEAVESMQAKTDAAYKKHFADNGMDASKIDTAYIEDELSANFLMDAIADRKLLDRLSGVKPSILQRFTMLIGNYIKSSPKGYKVGRREMERLMERMRESMMENANTVSGDLTGQEYVETESGELAMARDKGEVLLSISTYEETGRDALSAFLAKAVKKKDLSQKDADDIWNAMEEIYKIAKDLKPGHKYFAEWSDAEVRLGKDGLPVGTVRVKNGDYEMNFDFSTVCKKRQTMDAVLNKMMRDEESVKDLDFGDQTTIVRINDIIKRHGFEIACAMCFVDAKRFRVGDYASTFRGKWNEMAESLIPQGSGLTLNTLNPTGEKASANPVSSVPDEQLNWTKIDEVLGNYKKGPMTTQQRIAKNMKEDPSVRILLGDTMLMSSESMDLLRADYPSIYEAANVHQGAGKPKIAHDAVQWRNEIINNPSITPEKAFAVGGVRAQSFSDFVVNLFFDYYEMFAEMAAKKLPGQSYTKEPAYVELFGLTGEKINMSLIPAVQQISDEMDVEFKENPEASMKFRNRAGLDENGNYIWADESFDYATALDLQAREGYKENVGTICVGVSDEHIRKLMADRYIHMVIPYHKSGLNPLVAEANNIHWFTDYTNEQHETYASGKSISKADNKKIPSFYECLEKTGDPRKAAEYFVRACEDNNIRPRFSRRANGEWLFCYKLDENGEPVIGKDGKKVVDDNYYKLLADFSLYDNDGNYTPQRAVRMVMPKNTKWLLSRYLSKYDKVLDRRNNEIDAIIADIQAELTVKYLSWEDQVSLMEAGDFNNVLRGKDERKSVMYVAKHPTELLKKIGLSDLPLVTTQKHYTRMRGKRWDDNGNIIDRKNHQISSELIAMLPEMIENPVAVFKSDPNLKAKGGVVILTDRVDPQGNPITVTINADQEHYVYDGVDGPAHFVNMYGRENFDNFLDGVLNNSGVLYLNKEKVNELQPQIAQKIEGHTTENDIDFNKILAKKDATVKPGERRFSISPTTGYEEGSIQDRVLNLLRSGTLEDAVELLQQWASDIESGKITAAEDETALRDAMLAKRPISPQEAAKKRAELDDMIKKYGAIKPGEKAARPVFLPKETTEGRKVSKYTRTVAEATQTPEWFVAEVERAVADNMGGFTYNISTDKAAMDYVEKRKRYGFEANLREWENLVNTGNGTGAFNLITKKDIALGEFLYTEAVKAGDVATATRLVAELSAVGTQAGQAVQAMRLMKKLTPSGQLYYLQKAVDRLNRDIERKHKKQSNIVIDPDLARAVLEAKTHEEMKDAMDKVLQDVANQAPVTIMDKWNTWRYFAMLGNPRTHFRNLASNVVFAPVTWVKDIIGATMESGMQAAGILKEEDRTKHIGQAFANVRYDFTIGRVKPNDYTEFADRDFEAMKETLKGGGKYNPSDLIRDKRPVFKSKATNWINKASNFNSEWLDREDTIFMQRAYVSAMSQYLAAHKADTATLETTKEGQALLGKARSYAAQEAQKATFRDLSVLASALNKFERTNTATQLIVGGVLPFKKTPINVLKRGVEYSPIGLGKSISYNLVKLKKGEKTAAECIDAISAGMSGTAIMALGVFLAAKESLRAGGGDDDKESAFEELQGAQKYSVVVGDKSYTIDWMAPFALPLFVGCELYNATAKKDADVADLVNAMALVAEPMFNLSMLDGLNRTLTTAGYSENPLSAVVASVFTGYIGQAVPTLAGQVARSLDGTRRTTYVDKNSKVPDTLSRFWQSNVQAKTPVYSQDLTPKLDAWGRTDTVGNKLLGALENFLSPGYANTIKTSAMEDELQRLYTVTGDAGVLPRAASKYFNVDKVRYDLNADEWVTFQTEMGQSAYDILTRLVHSQAYQSLSDADKASAVADIYTYTKEKAKKAAVPAYETDKAWIGKADELASKGLSVEDYVVQAVIGEATSGQNTLDLVQMSWLDDDARALLISAEYGKSLTKGNTFTDPFKKGYAFEMTEVQTKQYLEKFDDLWMDGYDKLIRSSRYRAASDAEKADMLDDLKKDTASQTKKWMASKLRKEGNNSKKKE